MSADSETPIDWPALLDWYMNASHIIEDLDACQVLVETMLDGTPEANLHAADALGVLTRDAQLWLLSHPCPERWNGEHMTAMVHVYMAVGALIVGVGGDPADADQGDLKEKVTDAGLMIDEVRMLVSRLSAALEI
jgi:hypothetical protein